MRVLGLSSGTSHDGIDAALVEFEMGTRQERPFAHGHDADRPGDNPPDADRPGDNPPGENETLYARLIQHDTVPYPAALREEILAALPPRRVGLDAVCRLDTRIGQAFAHAAETVLSGAEADLICSHGQTVYHWPGQGTLQLGQPAWIAERTGLPVVSDLRARDIAAGGQGAPLIPVLDLLLLAGFPGRPGALNIGGIANLTVRSGPLAYDVGPGNALLDSAALHFTGTPIDRDGRLAAQGRIRAEVLERLLEEPYYRLPPPKSTGKELFHPGYLTGVIEGIEGIEGIGGADVLATLVELTAVVIATEIRYHELDTVLVSGGGVHNGALMRRLGEAVGTTRLIPSDAVGVPVDAKEAVLFALIGWLTAHGLAGSVAACTGARNASILGSVTGPLVPRTAVMPTRLEMAASPA